ncbi:MAG: repressor LexA, partial [Elusimicrobia bacterium]|nr:repressor LexA [Elusimicrobiota bacterium]
LLSSKQQRVLNAIREFQRLHNKFPSYKELADVLGYSSINSIQQFIKVLVKKKYLNSERGEGIKGLEKTGPSQIDLANIPVVGHVSCGTPILAQENIEGYIPTEKNLVKNKPGRFFFLRANGDSMNAAGIDDKDLLLIESKSTANPGEKILALIEDEATVKFFRPKKDLILLVPKSKNPIYKPIIVSKGFAIQGVVRRVVKKADLTA